MAHNIATDSPIPPAAIGGTGTLIESSNPALSYNGENHLVLTAAHTLFHFLDHGTSYQLDGQFHFYQRPAAFGAEPETFFGLGLAHPSGRDIGIMLLEDPVPAAAARLATSAEFNSIPLGASLEIEGGEGSVEMKRGTAILSTLCGSNSYCGEGHIGLVPGPHYAVGGDSGGPVFASISGGRRLVGVTIGVYSDPSNVAVRPDVIKSWAEGDFVLGYDGPGFSWQELDNAINRETVIYLNRSDEIVDVTQTGKFQSVPTNWAVFNNENLKYTYKADASSDPRFAGLHSREYFHYYVSSQKGVFGGGTFPDGGNYFVDFDDTPVVQRVEDPFRVPQHKLMNTGLYNGQGGTLELLGAGLDTTKLDNHGDIVLKTKVILKSVYWSEHASLEFVERPDLLHYQPAEAPPGTDREVVFTPSVLIAFDVRNEGYISVDPYSDLTIHNDFWNDENGRLVLESVATVVGNCYQAGTVDVKGKGKLNVLGEMLPVASKFKIGFSEFTDDNGLPAERASIISSRKLVLSADMEPIRLELATFDPLTNQPGLATGFNPLSTYSFPLIETVEGITNYSPDRFILDTSQFVNNFQGGYFSLSYSNNTLWLNYDRLAGGTLKGDFNQNGTVDAADYVIWRRTVGSTTNMNADADQNNVIDYRDFDIWRATFASNGHVHSRVPQTGIPEPATSCLILVAVSAACALQRLRRGTARGCELGTDHYAVNGRCSYSRPRA